MDSVILELEQISIEMADKIDQATWVELESFTEAREKLIQTLQSNHPEPSFWFRNREAIGRISALDPIILKRMEELHHEAQDGIRRISGAHKQRGAYEAGFGETSILYDRKK